MAVNRVNNPNYNNIELVWMQLFILLLYGLKGYLTSAGVSLSVLPDILHFSCCYYANIMLYVSVYVSTYHFIWVSILHEQLYCNYPVIQ